MKNESSLHQTWVEILSSISYFIPTSGLLPLGTFHGEACGFSLRRIASCAHDRVPWGLAIRETAREADLRMSWAGPRVAASSLLTRHGHLQHSGWGTMTDGWVGVCICVSVWGGSSECLIIFALMCINRPWRWGERVKMQHPQTWKYFVW